MRIASVVVPACLLAAAAAHAEKKVYKCTDADGSAVFSPEPCGANAQEMKVDAAAPAASGPARPQAPAPQGTAASAAAVPDADDIRCRQDAERLKTYPADANLQMLLQRQGDLMRKYAASGSEADKVEIGNLDVKIAAEEERIGEARQRADRTYASAIVKCDAARAARDGKTGSP